MPQLSALRLTAKPQVLEMLVPKIVPLSLRSGTVGGTISQVSHPMLADFRSLRLESLREAVSDLASLNHDKYLTCMRIRKLIVAKLLI